MMVTVGKARITGVADCGRSLGWDPEWDGGPGGAESVTEKGVPRGVQRAEQQPWMGLQWVAGRLPALGRDLWVLGSPFL